MRRPRLASVIAVIALSTAPLAASAQTVPAPQPATKLPPAPTTNGPAPTNQTVHDATSGYSTTSTTSTPGVQQPPPPPAYLPDAPSTGNPYPTHDLLIDALNAVERQQVTNPDQAPTAAADYTQAVNRYAAHDYAGARTYAAQAIADAALPSFVNVNAATPTPAYVQHATANPFTWTDTPTVDAESFLGLARDALARCAATGDALTAAQKTFAAAQADLAAHQPIATRDASIATLNACAGGTSQPVAL